MALGSDIPPKPRPDLIRLISDSFNCLPEESYTLILEKSLWHKAVDPIAAGVAGATDTILSPFGMGDDAYTADVRRENPTSAALGQALPYEVATGLAGGAAIKGLGGIAKGAKHLLPGRAQAALRGLEALLSKAPKAAPEEGLARPALDAMRSKAESGANLRHFLTEGAAPELESIPLARAPRTGPGRLSPQDFISEQSPAAPTPTAGSPSNLSQALEATQKRPVGKPGNAPVKRMTTDEIEALAGGPIRKGEPLGEFFKRLSDAVIKR